MLDDALASFASTLPPLVAVPRVSDEDVVFVVDEAARAAIAEEGLADASEQAEAEKWLVGDEAALPNARGFQYAIAKGGVAAAERMRDQSVDPVALTAIRAPWVVRAMAVYDPVNTVSLQRIPCLEYLLANRDYALRILVPDALGSENEKERLFASVAVRFLSGSDEGRSAIAIAEPWGEPAVRAIHAIISFHLVHERSQPDADRNPPGWDVPKLKLRDGTPLGDDVMRKIGHALFREPEPLHPLYGAIAEAFDDASRLAVANALVAIAAKASYIGAAIARWIARAAVGLGAPVPVVMKAVTRDKKSDWRRAMTNTAIEAFGELGTPEALDAVVTMASSMAPWWRVARGVWQVVAMQRGVSMATLADRVVPTLGFDARGNRDAPPFRIALSSLLEPTLMNAAGKTVKSARGDAAVIWKDVKKQLPLLANTQTQRLALAMVLEQTWRKADFEEDVVKHPILFCLAGRLLWRATFGAEERYFTVGDDRELVPADGRSLDLPEDARIMLLHPVHVPAETRAALGQFLFDYKILQPFDQLARQVVSVDECVGMRVDALRLSNAFWRMFGGSDPTGAERWMQGTFVRVYFEGRVSGYLLRKDHSQPTTISRARAAGKRSRLHESEMALELFAAKC